MQVEDFSICKYTLFNSELKFVGLGFDELSNINKNDIYVVVNLKSIKDCYGYFELHQKDLDKYKETTVKCYQITRFKLPKEFITYKGLEFLLPLLFISNSEPDIDTVYWYEKNDVIYAIEFHHTQNLSMFNLEDFINPLLSE